MHQLEGVVRFVDFASHLVVARQVSWRKPDKTFGVRFDAKDERRLRIKELFTPS